MRFSALAATCLFALGTTPALAQVQEIQRPVVSRASAPVPADRATEAELPPPLHVTDWLSSLPESRAALQEYQRRLVTGTLPVAGKSSATIGSQQIFNVYNFATLLREQIDFTLLAEDARFNIWVETAEYPARVDDALVEELRVALADQTPAGSYDPDWGIIEIDEFIFGQPPNADGDGKTDVLVLDIRDDCDTDPTQCVLGFFYGADLADFGKDIIYLDIDPGLTAYGNETVLQTAAHEYQHLIHARYDPAEESFVNEGLSEWAEVLNGYTARGIDYLDDLFEQRQTLIDWPPPGAIGSNEDYQRAGLFTSYIAEQIGQEKTGEITQSAGTGAAGYQSVLTTMGEDLDAVVRDFHVANFVNDQLLGARYGYSTPQYTTVSATARTTWHGAADDGIPATQYGPLEPGAVDYHVIQAVTNLTLNLYPPDGAGEPDLVYSDLAPMLVVTWDDGTREVRSIPVQDAGHHFPGTIQQAVVIVPYAQVNTGFTPLTYEMSATWENANPDYVQQEFIFDDGAVTNFVLLYPTDRVATRFDVPTGSILSSVSAGHIYADNISGNTVPEGAPRDYRLRVWGGSPGTGTPESLIFTLDRDDERAYTLSQVGTTYYLEFDEIDLAPYQESLGGLPATVFISLESTGPDINYIHSPLSWWDPLVGDTPSLMYSPDFGNDWLYLSGIGPESDPSVRYDDRVAPIRASFLVPADPVANEDDTGIPDGYALEANWPNPFNPATTIAYRMSATGDVRLAVYDLLGRRVATLVDGVMPAGRHEVRFDAAGLASGLYLYRLDAGTERITRTMMLVK